MASDFKAKYPLLPLRDIVLFPHEVRVLYVGREKSILALTAAGKTASAEGDKGVVLFVAQMRARVNDPRPEDLYRVGTLGQIVQLIPLPDGTMKVLVEGLGRVQLGDFVSEDRFLACTTASIEEPVEAGVEATALVRSVQAIFKAYVDLNKHVPPEIPQQVATIDAPGRLSDTVATHIQWKSTSEKQAVLEVVSPSERLTKILSLLQSEVEILKEQRRIKTRVKKQMERTQREHLLNEQMQAIQRELGDRDEGRSEVAELEERLEATKVSEEAHAKIKKEIRKLKLMSPLSAEATVVRNYIDWVLSLPWGVETSDSRDLNAAEATLNEDHYGLTKVKERVLEYLAVQQLAGKVKGPILCFLGPPGVGKTSLGRSIARALSRKFVRVALGGVRDEAEIRGHRRTYIGAMPGKVIQSLKRAESSNPVILLDEIDKLSSDIRGDPASALLEVLDPEQNGTFTDHYLDLEFDLSKVVFLCTANSMQYVPSALADRLEVIQIAGYTEDEKIAIARKYLVPKQREANGLGAVPVAVTAPALRKMIRRYTRESGVRGLERELAKVFRKVARDVVANPREDASPILVTQKEIQHFLGVPKVPRDLRETEDRIGLVNGLAWTSHGGEVLHTEAITVAGKGKLIVTGMLKDVMKESAQAAVTWVRSRAALLGIDTNYFEVHDVHIHFPGPDSKDGPSAGVTMAAALVSAVTQVPVRHDVAMTGEITLRGRVTAVGGLKEKCLAAHRLGIRTVILPRENLKDLKEIPKRIRGSLRFVPVDFVDEVLREALSLSKPLLTELPIPPQAQPS